MVFDSVVARLWFKTNTVDETSRKGRFAKLSNATTYCADPHAQLAVTVFENQYIGSTGNVLYQCVCVLTFLCL